MRTAEPRMPTSRSPPARHTVTQVPQPTSSTRLVLLDHVARFHAHSCDRQQSCFCSVPEAASACSRLMVSAQGFLFAAEGRGDRAAQAGSGPACRQPLAHGGRRFRRTAAPSAEERLNISSRSGSRPISASSCLRALDAPPGAQVAFQEVAAAFQAAGHDHAVHAALEGRQQVVHLDLARAGQPQHADVGRDTARRIEPARSAAA